MKTKHTKQSGLFNLRSVLICAATCSIAAGTLMAFFSSETPPKLSQRTLTFAERVAYQRPIEEIYWRHRIWPRNGGERRDVKPPLDAVMSQAQLEKKVTDYLRKSQALEDEWQRPITDEDLQAEMDRMAKHTKQPEVLRELFETLGNDPFVIAECLVRAVLAERLVTELNDRDRVNLTNVAWPKRTLQSWPVRTGTHAPGKVTTIQVNRPYYLPTIAGPSGACTDDTWAPTGLTNAPDGREFATAVWTGTEMIVWGGGGPGGQLNTGGRYMPSSDSWTETSTTNAPPREEHTAVWTGSEMIVWGGVDCCHGPLNTGGRYNPATDTWTATSITNAPSGRFDHTAVWTGSEMIVWGGTNADSTGGRYNPGTDTWTATSITGAPSYREGHTAVWTGTEMIIWGGVGGPYLNTGGKYNPSTDSWTPTSNADAPDPRDAHTAVWTGTEMIVWGGFFYDGTSHFLNTGGQYFPSADGWLPTNLINAPEGRLGSTAVWTGHEMIVWGGYDGSSDLNTGGRYSPSTNSWTATSTTDAPSARGLFTAVWTGSQMVVWGGWDGSNYLNTGGKYCAQAPPTPTPTATMTASATATVTASATATASTSVTTTPTATATARATPTPRIAPTPRPHPTPAPRP